MWTRHVGAHVVDEAISGLGVSRALTVFATRTGWSVFHSEDNVEELDEGALGVAASAILSVLGIVAIVVQQPVWQSSITHVFTSS